MLILPCHHFPINNLLFSEKNLQDFLDLLFSLLFHFTEIQLIILIIIRTVKEVLQFAIERLFAYRYRLVDDQNGQAPRTLI